MTWDSTIGCSHEAVRVTRISSPRRSRDRQEGGLPRVRHRDVIVGATDYDGTRACFDTAGQRNSVVTSPRERERENRARTSEARDYPIF